MNVAILVNSGGLSGAEKRCAKIAQALIERGHRVVMLMGPKTCAALTGRGYRFAWPPIVEYDFPRWVRWLGRGRGRLAPLRRALGVDLVDRWAHRQFWRRLLARHRIDLVHVFLDWPCCRDLPVPHLFEVTSPEWARKIIASDFVFPARTLLHPNSEGVDAALGGHFRANRRIVAPTAYFDPQEPADFVPPTKENLIVFGHRLAGRKNPVVFAHAAKRFVAARPAWRVAIRGTGPLEPDVRAVVAPEVAAGRILLGFHPNLMDELHRARVFVSIESEDNYSNQSVLEAMWCCNALVLSDRGRTRARYFADNGILCEPDADAVLAALLELADDPDRLARCAENSRRHVETAFSRDRYLDHLESVYREALAGRSTPAAEDIHTTRL